MINTLTRLFPVWAILLSVFAYLEPGLFTPLKPGLFFLLGLVMFGMGISLKSDDFIAIIGSRAAVFMHAIFCLGHFVLAPFTLNACNRHDSGWRQPWRHRL